MQRKKGGGRDVTRLPGCHLRQAEDGLLFFISFYYGVLIVPLVKHKQEGINGLTVDCRGLLPFPSPLSLSPPPCYSSRSSSFPLDTHSSLLPLPLFLSCISLSHHSLFLPPHHSHPSFPATKPLFPHLYVRKCPSDADIHILSLRMLRYENREGHRRMPSTTPEGVTSSASSSAKYTRDADDTHTDYLTGYSCLRMSDVNPKRR